MDFRPTWLYVKECPHCGLLYVGKTTSKDPRSYRGSGTYWLRHLDKHGIDVPLTRKTQLFTSARKVKAAALRFSVKHDVANSDRWANLRDEDGIGAGGAHSDRTKRKISRSRSGISRWYNNGVENRMLTVGNRVPYGFIEGRIVASLGSEGRAKCREAQLGVPKSKTHRKSLSIAAKGKVKSAEHVAKIAQSKRGQKWYNDGVRSYQLFPTDPRTHGLSEGRMPAGWFNDGVRVYRAPPNDPRIKRLGWKAGRSL